MIRSASSARTRTDEYVDVSHSGETYRVILKRIRGARRYTLRIRAASRDVVLSMPYRGKVAEAKRFAGTHAAWIGARIRRLPEPVPFAHGSVLPLRGIDHRIVHMGKVRGTVWAGDIDSAGVNESSPQRALFVAGDSAHVSRRVMDFLKQQARKDLLDATRVHASKIGRTPAGVTLRDTSSRWGSCSSSGALSFSWRLILAPAYVLDYLAAHEVAHLRHLDHSDDFWALTRELCAETDRAEAWLRAHGADLHRYGKSA